MRKVVLQQKQQASMTRWCIESLEWEEEHWQQGGATFETRWCYSKGIVVHGATKMRKRVATVTKTVYMTEAPIQ